MDREHLQDCGLGVKLIKLIDRIDNLLEMDPADGFLVLYRQESLLLAEVLKDADEQLYQELVDLCQD